MTPEEQSGPDEGLTAEEAPASDRPEWLPDKFSSPEELAVAYREAERDRNETRREMNELRGDFEALTENLTALNEREQRHETQQGMSQQEADLVSALERARDDGDTRAELAIMAHISSLSAQAAMPQQQATSDDTTLTVLSEIAEQKLRAQYPDFDEYRERIADTLTTTPGLIAAATLPSVQGGIDAAYRLAKAETLMAAESQAQQQSAQAEAERQQKLAAQGLTGGGARQAPASEAHDHMQSLINMRSGTFSELLEDARRK